MNSMIWLVNIIHFLIFDWNLQEQFLQYFATLPLYNDPVGGKKENFHYRVIEHKDIKKVIVILKTAVSSEREKATGVLKQFSPFSVIWKEDRKLKVKVCFPANIEISCFYFQTEDIFSYNCNIMIIF